MCKETIPGYTSLWAESQGQVAKEGEEEDDHKPRQGLHQMEIDQKWINGLGKSKPGKTHVSAGKIFTMVSSEFHGPIQFSEKKTPVFRLFQRTGKPRCEPWCWNIYLHDWVIFRVFM